MNKKRKLISMLGDHCKHKCHQIAEAMGLDNAEVSCEHHVCVIEAKRDNRVIFHPTGHVIHSPHVHVLEISIEKDHESGRYFNLVECVLYQSEVSPLLRELERVKGMHVTAIHNHELKTKPLMVYMHWYNQEHPAAFASKMHYVLRHTINPRTGKSILHTIK